jgi:hypothetical protein
MTHAQIEGRLGADALARGSEILGKGIASLVARDAPHATNVLTVPIGSSKNQYLVDGVASACAELGRIGKMVTLADHVTCVFFCFVLLFRFSPFKNRHSKTSIQTY